MQRRDFLHPRNILQPALDLLGAAEELRELLRPQAPATTDAVLWRFGRRAMATTFEVVLPAGTPLAREFAHAALDEIDAIESQLTVFREDSPLSQVNDRAAREAVRLDDDLFQLLTQCQWLWRETAGAFDIALGTLVKCWGFYQRQPTVPVAAALADARKKSGMRHVTLEPRTKTIRFGVAGLEINLGSIGKGYALDRVGDVFRRDANLTNLLLQGGQSSALALGSQPGSRRGWAIGLTDPDNTSRRLGILHVQNRGIGTSAATFQHLEHHGRKLGHILDPRSGWPAEGMLCATVTAPNATLADALATAFFILGPDAARDFCAAHPSFGAVLLTPENYPRPIVLGRAREEWRALA